MRRGLGARRDVVRRMRRMDAERDAHALTRGLVETVYGDALLVEALFVVDFMRQVAVGDIGRVVWRRGVGDMVTATRKRIDDSLLLFGMLYHHGPHTDVGRTAVARLKDIHDRFTIRPDDYVYTFATLAIDPVRVVTELGAPWAIRDNERRSLFHFWRSVADAWGVELPGTVDDLRAWMEEYERREYARTEGGVAVSRAMIDAYAAHWFPRPVRWIGSAVIRTLCDVPLLAATGLPPAPRPLAAVIRLVVRGYLRARRVVPGPTGYRYPGQWGAEYRTDAPAPEAVGPAWSLR